MIKKNKNILFYESVENNLPHLEKSQDHIPEWWKKSYTHIPNAEAFKSRGMKLCMPFLDSMSSGYMLVTPCDIVVEFNNNRHEIIIPEIYFRIDKRDSSHNPKMPIPIGHYNDHYAWVTNTTISLPNGYSALYTHPFNRHDLPFTTLSGIIDLDQNLATGAIPFFLKKGFEGLIPQGTPYIQILPFKRENWQSKEQEGLFEKSSKTTNASIAVVSGWYKKNRWHRKSFE